MEIKKGRSVYMGVKEENGQIVCEKCGNNSGKTIMHMDGKDFYETQLKCECGNVMAIHTKRSKKDMMYWA